MKEKERKFILKYLPEGLESVKIIQGYMMLDGNKHLRVRVVSGSRGVQCYLTFKNVLSKTVKEEYEYLIPYHDAVEMLDNTNRKLEKVRYHDNFKGNHVDIDIYPNGIQVVEIEYEDELDELPDYCGVEVTGQREYSNIYIASLNKNL